MINKVSISATKTAEQISERIQRGWIVDCIATRSDGYLFMLCRLGRSRTADNYVILAGCRQMTLNRYRRHARSYGNAGKSRETNHILDLFEDYIKLKWTRAI